MTRSCTSCGLTPSEARLAFRHVCGLTPSKARLALRRAFGAPLVVLVLPLLLVVAGCGGFGGRLEPVEDEEIVALAIRMDDFYRSLENRTLDTLATFEDRRLRSYFADDTAFSDYYASLASQVRRALLRHGKVENATVLDFSLEEGDHALVRVQLRGRHQRQLRFWSVELDRTDSWRRLSGRWFLVPEDL